MITRRGSWMMTACGAMSLLGVVLAAATIWLMTTEPLKVARALDERNLSAMALAIAETLARAARLLVRYL